MSINRRLDALEEQAEELESLERRKRAAAGWRVLSQLTAEKKKALVGDLNEETKAALADVTDEELLAMARGEAPLLKIEDGYEPPKWVIERVRELATPAERRLLGV